MSEVAALIGCCLHVLINVHKCLDKYFQDAIIQIFVAAVYKRE